IQHRLGLLPQWRRRPAVDRADHSARGRPGLTSGSGGDVDRVNGGVLEARSAPLNAQTDRTLDVLNFLATFPFHGDAVPVQLDRLAVRQRVTGDGLEGAIDNRNPQLTWF